MKYDFTRYLSAKKTVDDRALNLRVWQRLADELHSNNQPENIPGASETRVIELGAGIGTMLERMLEWNLLRRASYQGLDAQHENIISSRERLPGWAAQQGYQVCSNQPVGFTIEGKQQRVEVNIDSVDIFDFIDRKNWQHPWDLMVAHAFLDLVDIPSGMPAILSLLRPGGLFYFTLNFDGMTLFEPQIDPAFDELIQVFYHRSMDERVVAGKRSGDSHTGRHLFNHLISLGAEILEAGASDWVVFPRSGAYLADEAYFLHFILHFFEQSLRDHPQLDALRFQDWIAKRHAQIESAELIYIAHQVDFVGRSAG